MVLACRMAQEALPAYAHRFSPRTCTLSQLFACLVLKSMRHLDFRGVVSVKLRTLGKGPSEGRCSFPGAGAEWRSRGAAAPGRVAQAAAARCVSIRSIFISPSLLMSRYRRAPHFVPATCSSRAATSINADCPPEGADQARPSAHLPIQPLHRDVRPHAPPVLARGISCTPASPPRLRARSLQHVPVSPHQVHDRRAAFLHCAALSRVSMDRAPGRCPTFDSSQPTTEAAPPSRHPCPIAGADPPAALDLSDARVAMKTVRIGEFTTPPRVFGGVLVDKPGSRAGRSPRRAK